MKNSEMVRWRRGETLSNWDRTDKDKVRHMLKRGKTVDFINRYTGMPTKLIEALQRQLNEDRTFVREDIVRPNVLNSAPPIPPSLRRQRKEVSKLTAQNRNFVRALRAQLEAA